MKKNAVVLTGDGDGMLLQRLKEFGVGKKCGWVKLHVRASLGMNHACSVKEHRAHDCIQGRLFFVMYITYSGLTEGP